MMGMFTENEELEELREIVSRLHQIQQTKSSII